MYHRKLWPLVALMGLLTVGPLHAQTVDGTPANKQVRDGFWIQFGIGFSTFGCEFCTGRNNEIAGDFAIGGAVGERWLVGFVSSSTTEVGILGDDRTINVGGIGAQYYPTLTSGFYVKGSLGLASGTSASNGVGGTVGLGFDTPRSGSFGFSPFADVMFGSLDDSSFNAVRFGVSLAWH